MAEIEFNINVDTGEMEMRITGIQGSSCSDVAKIATELLGTPQLEERTAEFYVQPTQVRLIQSKRN